MSVQPKSDCHSDRANATFPMQSPKPRVRGQSVPDSLVIYAPDAQNNGDDGHTRDATPTHTMPSSPDIVSIIRSAHRRRRFAMETQRKLNLSALHFIRINLGWHTPNKTDEDRKRIKADSTAMFKAIEKGKPLPAGTEPVFDAVGATTLSTVKSRETFDAMRKVAESEMRAAVRQLPAWPALSEIRGLAEIALGSIVGEAGDLNDFATVSKLWKYLGLAPPSSYEMVTKQGKTVKAIPRRRRSVVFTVGDSLIKGNRQGTEPLEYRKLYLERKAAREAAEWGKTKMHRHRDAQRYMEKRLIRDIWTEWRRAMRVMRSTNDLPVAN